MPPEQALKFGDSLESIEIPQTGTGFKSLNGQPSSDIGKDQGHWERPRLTSSVRIAHSGKFRSCRGIWVRLPSGHNNNLERDHL